MTDNKAAHKYELNDMLANIRTHIPDFAMATQIMGHVRAALQRPEPSEGADLKRCWNLIKNTAVQDYDPVGKNSGLLFKNHKSGDYAFISENDVAAIEAALAPRQVE